MGSAPIRLQLSRRRGFRLDALSLATNGLSAVNVARPSIYGNPCLCSRSYGCPRHPDFERWAWADDTGEIDPLRCCVDVYRHYVETGLAGEPTRTGRLTFALDAATGYLRRTRLIAALPKLRGKNLACWCRIENPCHADVLLELANT
ncbi:MAG TPA: DUF4326 domain-containing protein [Bradyrhizobium sp.]|nr:DUF4326 domain-containing protein [Bradyrhizobium sp.]